MAKKTIIVCDVCESDSNVTTWEIKAVDSGEKKKVEVCGKHAELLALLLRGDVTGGSVPRRRRGATSPMTLDEIEAQKRAGGV
jgi:hypothetical protein